jgi:fibro-slime domain-containing protein
VKSTLGPDGLPVESTPGLFGDVNGAGELLWWSPDGVNVTAGSSNFADGVYSLPFNVPSNFFANGGSNGGANGYISTELKATFTAPLGGTVTFNLGSDDDSWIFLNGNLVADNGGVHAFQNISFPVTTGLIDGTNTVVVFQVDRHVVQSGLYFDANVMLNSVPEPSTWAMMGLGFAALGFAGYRARKTSVSIA